jgi:hypothetical protein
MTGARNVKGGLALLSTGLAAGLRMSLYAFEPLAPAPLGHTLEEELGTSIPDAEAAELRTLADVVGYVERCAPSTG